MFPRSSVALVAEANEWSQGDTASSDWHAERVGAAVVHTVKRLLADKDSRYAMRREARRIAWSRHTWEDCVAKLLFWHRFLNERQSNAGVWESTMQARLDLRPGDRDGCGRGGQMDHEREDAAKYHGEVGSTHLLAA